MTKKEMLAIITRWFYEAEADKIYCEETSKSHAKYFYMGKYQAMKAVIELFKVDEELNKPF